MRTNTELLLCWTKEWPVWLIRPIQSPNPYPHPNPGNPERSAAHNLSELTAGRVHGVR